MIPSTLIAVSHDLPEHLHQAQILAARLKLSLVDGHSLSFPYLLVIGRDRLEIRQTAPNSPGPVYVDFTSGAQEYRRRFGGGKKQHLPRAIGLKAGISPFVLDATAGLGRDAFLLAALGCRVLMVERSPLMAVLLEDGLRRAGQAPQIQEWLDARLSLKFGSIGDLAATGELPQQPEVVYLDPMHPARGKSALVKKEMRLLRALVGEDPDAPNLLRTALQLARHRVVVKRPRLAASISGPKPSYAVSGRSSRFDVYLV